jgi:hypothetical protein
MHLNTVLLYCSGSLLWVVTMQKNEKLGTSHCTTDPPWQWYSQMLVLIIYIKTIFMP